MPPVLRWRVRDGGGWREVIARLVPSIPGIVLAAAAFCASLTPSLIPRGPVEQGLLSGLVTLVAYEIGNVLFLLWRFMQLPVLPRRIRGMVRLVIGAILVVIMGYCMYYASDWQNAAREVAGAPPVDTLHPLRVIWVALAVLMPLYLIARGMGVIFERIETELARLLPPRVSVLLAVLATAWLVWAVTDGVVLQRAFEAADDTFEAADLLVEPDTPRPADPLLSGSDASLIRWEEMGRWGRAFVTTRPEAAEIATFRQPAMDPIRVYVGRSSAETAEERAQLALDEMIRVGAFERQAILIATPVGTGFMDPDAHDSLEFVLGGDVATVGVQYSYLTSALALLVHPEYGIDQSRALFDTIYSFWLDLPERTRPDLYVFGLSQGAFNSQSTLPVLDMLADPIAGGVWAGSPFLSPLWQQVRDDREPGSPAWRPVFGNSSLVRVMNQQGGGHLDGVPWGPIRLVLIQYGSDPIGAFSFPSAFRRPDWLSGERAPDVAPQFRWFPVVTTLQLALDMAISQKIDGFGHEYVAEDYIEAWVEVLAPEDWSRERTDALQRIFAKRPSPY